ncbi:hypothetical protein [Halorhabdus sp. BNX81]|uniref:hypothetical protein n=1 Tax=Halorhabdus sp. BNX81 TaxID=2980181 RepID=UPI0023DD1897|nr:hypothetical protein [Halorhabdus sp. BNX81]
MERINPKSVFGGTKNEQVDFEIAFTAFIVTIVLSTSTNDPGYRFLSILVILMSGLTLLRKMAVSNQHAPAQPLLEWTMPFILTITIVSSIHVFLAVGTFIIGVLGWDISAIYISGPFVPLSFLAIFLLHEKIFHDASLYLAILGYNAAVKAERANSRLTDNVKDWFLFYVAQLASVSNSPNIPPELTELDDERQSYQSKSIIGLFLFGMLIFTILWMFVSWLFGSFVLNLLFLLMVFFVKYPIQFWYSRFGLARFPLERFGWFDYVIIALGLLISNLTILPIYA